MGLVTKIHTTLGFMFQKYINLVTRVSRIASSHLADDATSETRVPRLINIFV